MKESCRPQARLPFFSNWMMRKRFVFLAESDCTANPADRWRKSAALLMAFWRNSAVCLILPDFGAMRKYFLSCCF
jgi:hypothetical protein